VAQQRQEVQGQHHRAPNGPAGAGAEAVKGGSKELFHARLALGTVSKPVHNRPKGRAEGQSHPNGCTVVGSIGEKRTVHDPGKDAEGSAHNHTLRCSGLVHR